MASRRPFPVELTRFLLGKFRTCTDPCRWPLRFVLVAVLLYAGVWKIVNSSVILAGTGLLSSTSLLSAVIGIEAAAAVYILLADSWRSWCLSLVTFSIFCTFAGYAFATERECNCISGSIGAGSMMLIDFFVVLLILAARPVSRTAHAERICNDGERTTFLLVRVYRRVSSSLVPICAVTGVAVFAWQWNCLPESPLLSEVRCLEPVWDFGTIDPIAVQEVKHTYEIENLTDRPVPIHKVTMSCGCMVAGELPKFIPARNVAQITLTTKIAGEPGPFQKSALVELGTETPAFLPLVVEGSLVATGELYSVPKTVDFGIVSRDEKKSRTVRLGRYDGTSLSISSVETGMAGIDATVLESHDKSRVEIVLTVDGALSSAEQIESSVVIHGPGNPAPLKLIPFRLKIAESSGRTAGMAPNKAAFE